MGLFILKKKFFFGGGLIFGGGGGLVYGGIFTAGIFPKQNFD